jgi:hypothetical protein
MTNFQDNLFSELLVKHGAVLESNESRGQRSTRRPARIAAGVLAAAAVFAGVGLTALGHSSPAYAVTENPNGTVTVSISDIQAIGPANAELQAMGVRAKAVPMTSDCASLESQATYVGPFSTPIEQGDSITIGSDIPVGYTMLLSVLDSSGSGIGFGFTAPVKDPAPSCVLNPTDDPAELPNP